MFHVLGHSAETLRRKAAPVRSTVRLALDLLYPPRCGGCSKPVGASATLCLGCFEALRFIGPIVCDRCGHPLPHAGPGDCCAACLSDPPPYHSARAALHYDAVSRPLLTRFKYGDRFEAVPLLTRWMRQEGEALAAASDLILPVPLHWRRHWKRRFNQSEVLARHLGQAWRLPVSDALVRRKATRPQVGLSRSAREKNVAHAFRVERNEQVKGRCILLIDDVMTSGATLEAASRVLLRAGAKEVRVLTLARRVLAESGGYEAAA